LLSWTESPARAGCWFIGWKLARRVRGVYEVEAWPMLALIVGYSACQSVSQSQSTQTPATGSSHAADKNNHS